MVRRIRGSTVGGFERLRRVADDVERRLRELLRIGVELRQAGIEIADHVDARKLRLHEASHARHDFVDVRALERRQPVRRQEPVDERLQAVGFADHHLRVFDKLRPVELALEELRGTANAAERIPDLVREVADQLAVRLLLLVQSLLAGDLQLLVDMPELEQQRGFLRLHRRHRAGQMEFRLAGDRELELLLGVGRAAADRLVDRRGQARGVRENLLRTMAHEMLLRELEQVLRGGIGVGHAPRGVEHEHGGGQQFDAGAGGGIVGGARGKELRDDDHEEYRPDDVNAGGVAEIANIRARVRPGASRGRRAAPRPRRPLGGRRAKRVSGGVSQRGRRAAQGRVAPSGGDARSAFRGGCPSAAVT